MANTENEGASIHWYRSPLTRETLMALNARSDFKGLMQSGGYLALLCCSAAATLWSAFAGYWYLTPLLLLLHGTFGTFLINAVHELCHNSVFKRKGLNGLFIRIFGFLGWIDWVHFNASHANHHRYTLHPPRDGEVVLPILWLTRENFWKNAICNWRGPQQAFKGALRKARGQWDDAWSLKLFPKDKPKASEGLIRWNRSLVLGHSIIMLASVAAALVTLQWGWLLLPCLVSFSNTYGGWLFFFCNNTQHVGLTDKVPDFRLCCRSMKLPGFVSFLYWNMEYHTEHHMYAAVPCYNLRKLQKIIAHDLPEAKGVVGTWKEIAMILERQKREPNFQYIHPLPDTAHPAELGIREEEIAAGAAETDANADCGILDLATAS